MFDKCLYFNAVKLSRTVSLLWESAYRPLGLSPSQAYLMQFILSEQGPTPKSLATNMELKLSTISRLLDGLAKKGLIERRKESKDKRECCIYPTNAGALIKEDLERITNDLREKAINIIGARELASAISTMDKLNKSIKRDVDGESL